MCMRLRKIQTSSRGDAYYECTWKTLRCLKGTRPSTCYAKKTMALAKINYSPSFTAFRAGKGKRETERQRKKETSALWRKKRRWTYWCQWHLRKSCRLYDGGLLLASWFCRAQFCSRTTAKTRRIVTLKMRLAISRFPAFPTFAVFK